MSNVKAYELRTKTKAELTKQLADLKQELSVLRVQKLASGQSNAKVNNIRSTRKAIARVLTVMSQNQHNQLKKLYAKRKYVPLDLRPKKTRAIRRRLTPFEASRKTERQRKKDIHFPLRKYAIKA